MTYFYNSNTGDWANESPPSLYYFQLETQLRIGVGWHAYGSMQAMQAAIRANHWPPANANASGASPVPGQVGNEAGKAANVTGVTAIGDFFNRLTEENTWLRVGEVIAGLLLLYLGLKASMTNTAAGKAVQSTTNTAKKAGMVAFPK